MTSMREIRNKQPAWDKAFLPSQNPMPGRYRVTSAAADEERVPGGKNGVRSMEMEIIKTICPRCFKIFSVASEVEEVKCNFCEYDYPLPRIVPREMSEDRPRVLGEVYFWR